MKILVTGGAGFIGSHVADSYIEAGHEVVVVDDLSTGKKENLNPKVRFYDIDISDDKLGVILSEERPDCVNHHAARASVSDSVKDPISDAKVNIIGFINLLEASVRAGVKEIIFASSGGCVYGEAAEIPIKEDSPFLAPASPYAASKIAGEFYLGYYNKHYGLGYTILRYSNVYGPRQDPYGEASVVAIFCMAMTSGESPAVNGAKYTGDEGCIRDFVYVKDVAKANLLVLGNGGKGAFNIGIDNGITIQDLWFKIADITDFEGKINYGPPRQGDLLKNVVSYNRAKSLLGWQPSVTVEEGLKETVEYFRSLKGSSGYGDSKLSCVG